MQVLAFQQLPDVSSSAIWAVLLTCCMYSVSENESTTTMILKYFITNSLSCSISYSIKSENASLIALSRVSAAALSRNP